MRGQMARTRPRHTRAHTAQEAVRGERPRELGPLHQRLQLGAELRLGAALDAHALLPTSLCETSGWGRGRASISTARRAEREGGAVREGGGAN